MPFFMGRKPREIGGNGLAPAVGRGYSGGFARPQAERAAPAASAFRQLELDPAVLAVGLFGITVLDRLELTEARRHQALGRNALLDQVLDDRDGAGRRKIPIGAEAPVGIVD